MSTPYDGFFEKYGKQYNVDPKLLSAMSMQESSGNANTPNSPAGAIGLMQIMPKTGAAFGVSADQLKDPETSVRVAAQLMAQNLDHYGNVQDALSAYNGGTNKNNWSNPETAAYASGVASKYQNINPQPNNAPVANLNLGGSQSSSQANSADDDSNDPDPLGTAIQGLHDTIANAQAAQQNDPFTAEIKAISGNRQPLDVSQTAAPQDTSTWGKLNHGYVSGLGGIYKGEQYLRDSFGQLVNDVIGSPVMSTNNYQKAQYDIGQYNQGYDNSRAANGQTGTDWGSLAGELATELPTMFVGGAGLNGAKLISEAGAKFIGKNALTGAAIGAQQNFNDPTQLAVNAGVGGALGGLGGAAVGGVSRLANIIFPKNAAQATVGRILSDAMGGSQSFAIPQTTDGFLPTTAQATQNPFIAALARSTQSTNPQYLERMNQNNNVLSGILKNTFGTPDDIATAEAQRSSAVAPLYDNANSAQIQGSTRLSQLLQRPSMQGAQQNAVGLAQERGDLGFQMPQGIPAENGIPAGNPIYSGQTLQDIKRGLDDSIISMYRQSGGSNALNAAKDTRQAFLDELSQLHPDYTNANQVFSDMSQPINQMEVGQALTRKLIPATSEINGTVSSIKPEQFANAMKNGDAITAKTLGNPSKTLESVLTPQQIAVLNQVNKDASSVAFENNAGRMSGSNTAQNLGILDHLGLGASAAAQNMLYRIPGFGWIPGYVAQRGESAYNNALSRALLDPNVAQQFMQQVANKSSPLWNAAIAPSASPIGLMYQNR